jgi:NAD(P)-dependent dehydrogenase (short-subunit alcohol dehydrogenase family)
LKGEFADKVVIVTGAGRGLGRSHALEFAKRGAKVVVNDLGGSMDGSGSGSAAADLVVKEIEEAGGTAVANYDSVATQEGGESIVKTAVDNFGRVDVLVNNAGILRDRMLFNMTEEEWDAVIRVHLKGTFCPTRHAATYWREQSKGGHSVAARVINTTSVSGLFANPGQANYGAAKSGIASFTQIAAKELGRYGVTANAISPGARTRMTENLRPGGADIPSEGFDERSADNIAPIAVWLGSADSGDVTGQTFEVMGGRVRVNETWRHGPAVEQDARWDPTQLGPVVRGLIEQLPEAEPVSGAPEPT